jgi:hypothetical protein
MQLSMVKKIFFKKTKLKLKTDFVCESTNRMSFITKNYGQRPMPQRGYLPTEIIDEIIVKTDFLTAITLQNEYAIKKLYNSKEHTWSWASRNGHLEIIVWFHKKRIEGCTTYAMDGSAEKGHLEVVVWLHENRTEGCTIDAMHYAAENGHLEVVVWLHENRTEGCTEEAMINAAFYGHLEVIKWLHKNTAKGPSSDKVSVASGNFGAITEGCTKRAMVWASQEGHLEVIKWFQENTNASGDTNAADN